MPGEWDGSRWEMKRIGSGWLKETKGARKFQRFIINEDVELKAKDVVCVYLAKNRRDEKSPQYYIFLDINARNKEYRSDRRKAKNQPPDPAPQEREPGDDEDAF